MRNAEDYRANALECERMGEITKNERDRRTWLEMAAIWRRKLALAAGVDPRPQASSQPPSRGQNWLDAE